MIRNAHPVAYADDLAIVIKGKNESQINSTIRAIRKTLEEWCISSGLAVKSEKSQALHFSGQIISTTIDLGDGPVEQSETVKYLGIMLDKKLTFKLHLKHLETKAKVIANALRLVLGKGSFFTISEKRRPLWLAIRKRSVVLKPPKIYKNNPPQTPTQLSASGGRRVQNDLER